MRNLDEKIQKFEKDCDAHEKAIEKITNKKDKRPTMQNKMITQQEMPIDEMDEKHRIIQKFEKEIFVKLIEEHRTDVLEEIQASLDDEEDFY